MNKPAIKPSQLIPLIVADIYELAGAFRGQGEQIARTVGQTQARWQVLSAASAERKTVPQIARRLGVTRQAVQRIANELVSEKLAAFEANPDHQGSPHLVPTAIGRDTLTRLGRSGQAFHARVAAALSASELRTIHTGLRRLIGALDRVLPDAKILSIEE